MYKILQYEKGKLKDTFNGKEWVDLTTLSKSLSHWYEVKRNPDNAQFLLIENSTDEVKLIIDKSLLNKWKI